MTLTQRLVVALLILVLVAGGIWAVVSVVGPSPPAPTSVPAAQATATTTLGTAGRNSALAVQTPAGTRHPSNDGGTVGVFVEPDDGRKPVLDELAAAKRSIDLEVYLLSDNEIISALERAQARGVRVRVILEQHPYGGAGDQPQIFKRLQQADVSVRWSNPTFKLTHIKTFVIDNKVAIIMTLNLTKTSFTGDRDFGAITTRPADVAEAAAIFSADWNRTAEPPPGPLVVSPTNSRGVLTGLIRQSRTTLDVYAEVIEDNQIVQTIADAAHRGVRVRLIMSKQANDQIDDQNRAKLEQAGVQVRLARGLYIHAKVLIVDGRTAYLGSENFTAASLDFNRELGIILSDPANVSRLANVFNGDFAKGRVEGKT